MEEFVNKVSKELYAICNVAHHITSLHHPAANRHVEILKTMTTEMMVKGLDEQDDWPDFVQTVAWNIQSHMHKLSAHSPLDR